jgi:integrase
MPTRKVDGAKYVYERISSDGRVTSYRVRIRRKGVPTSEKSFYDLVDAKRHVATILRHAGKPLKVSHIGLPQLTVGDVIDDAILRIDSGRRTTKGAATERLRLAAFKRDYLALCATALADASEDMFEDWMADRLETVKPNTVLRDFALLKPIFATAARKAALRYSPLEYIKPPRAIDERRIHPDEEALLFAELNCAQDPIVPLAARFSLETGCRRSECLRIEWRDFDSARGTIWLSDAKNGRGRYLLLTILAQNVVEDLSRIGSSSKIFPVTGNLLKKAFEYARSRAANKAAALGRSDIKSLLRYRHPKVDESVARLRALAS